MLQRTTKSAKPRWLNNFVSSVACLSFAAANSRHYPKAFPSLSVMVQSTMHIAKGFTKSIEEPTKRNMIFQKQPALRRSERKMATMGFANAVVTAVVEVAILAAKGVVSKLVKCTRFGASRARFTAADAQRCQERYAAMRCPAMRSDAQGCHERWNTWHADYLSRIHST